MKLQALFLSVLVGFSAAGLPTGVDVRGTVVSAAFPPEPTLSREDIVLPYSTDNLWRGFTGGKCKHQGLDFGGIGENGGIGTPVVSMVRSKIILIGDPKVEPKKLGSPDKRKGKTRRGRKTYPRIIEVEGYGTVYPFTRTKGSWGAGATIIAQAIGTSIDGYTIRYMHLAAIHPDLKVGDIVEAGQEIGLLGGTGVQKAGPHLHLDIEDTKERRVDPAWILGLVDKPAHCKALANGKKAKKSDKKSKNKKQSCTAWAKVSSANYFYKFDRTR